MKGAKAEFCEAGRRGGLRADGVISVGGVPGNVDCGSGSSGKAPDKGGGAPPCTFPFREACVPSPSSRATEGSSLSWRVGWRAWEGLRADIGWLCGSWRAVGLSKEGEEAGRGALESWEGGVRRQEGREGRGVVWR